MTTDERLEQFNAVNKRDRASKKKASWSERKKLLETTFPAVVRADFRKLFTEDVGIMGKLVNDILKADPLDSNRPGKRPSLETKEAAERFRRVFSEDYSMLPFHEAFTILKGTRSVRHMARNVGLDKAMVHGLLRNDIEPSMSTIEKIAKALKKDPSYFLEYRVGYTLGVLSEHLYDSPESSVVLYKKLKNTVK